MVARMLGLLRGFRGSGRFRANGHGTLEGGGYLASAGRPGVHRAAAGAPGRATAAPGQDFRVPAGDSLVILASPAEPGENVCVERASTPLLAGPVPGLYRKEQVPVFRGGSLDSAWEAGAHLSLEAVDTAYSRYQLNYSGSKSMAVTVGSGGGLGLDASLFINLNGQVAEDVFVEGQLSDQNVPIQPEGNTATLKEVDTKFVRVFGSHYSYTLGNFLMDYGAAGEDRFTAKVQGVDGAYFRDGYALHGSWSLSDGQYQSDTLRGVDGKQRGYYLRGKDGRQFITVLAGTERVWRNAVPLKRGVDYTIDYSEGRLDFLPPLVVTSENLFAAEFQYTEQDYQRSLSSGEVRDSSGAITRSVRAISELENKDHPLGLALDSAQLRRFSGLGDSPYQDSGRFVAMPHRQSAAAADLAVKFYGYAGRAALLFSQLDRNLYSGKDDEDNLGFSTRYLGTHTLGRPIDSGGFGRTVAIWDHEYRAPHYESFKQLIEPRGFAETWNLDARIATHGFMANRLRLEERPLTFLVLGAEVGRADADSAADAGSAQAAAGSLSRRGGASARLGGESRFLEASTEAKLARSPDRRDNYRQYGGVHWETAGIKPSLIWTRNEWLTELRPGIADPTGIPQGAETWPIGKAGAGIQVGDHSVLGKTQLRHGPDGIVPTFQFRRAPGGPAGFGPGLGREPEGGRGWSGTLEHGRFLFLPQPPAMAVGRCGRLCTYSGGKRFQPGGMEQPIGGPAQGLWTDLLLPHQPDRRVPTGERFSRGERPRRLRKGFRSRGIQQGGDRAGTTSCSD